MKNVLRIAAIVPLFTCVLVAQQKAAPASAAPATAPANSPGISPGSVIPITLTKTIDAKKAKTGDEVVGKVTMDMKTASGDVLVPKDTKVIGHVTQVQAHNKEQKESQLSIAFNQAVLKDQPMNLPMSIQAVVGEEQNNNDNAGEGGGVPPSPSSTGTGGSSPMAGRSPSAPSSPMSGQMQAPPSGQADSSDAPKAGARPPINGKTQGVVGISNLSLSPNSNAQQGSTLTSEKNNVKLESGTLLLLRVNQ
ncbi:MAG: hypothetical protein ACRD3B_18245 [Candidatus Sulfotelmatobacter sp.]